MNDCHLAIQSLCSYFLGELIIFPHFSVILIVFVCMGFGQVPIGFGQVIIKSTCPKGKWAFSILSNTAHAWLLITPLNTTDHHHWLLTTTNHCWPPPLTTTDHPHLPLLTSSSDHCWPPPVTTTDHHHLTLLNATTDHHHWVSRHALVICWMPTSDWLILSWPFSPQPLTIFLSYWNFDLTEVTLRPD